MSVFTALGVLSAFATALWLFFDVVTLGKVAAADHHLLGIVVNVFAASIFLVIVVIRRRYSWGSLLIGYFWLVSVAYTGLYQEATAFFAWPVVHTADDIAKVSYIYILFGIFFLFGAELNLSRRRAASIPPFSSISLYMVILSLMISIGALAVAGPGAVFSSRVGLTDQDVQTFSLQAIWCARSVCLAAHVMCLCISRSSGAQPSIRQSASTLFRLNLFWMIVWFNPVGCPRAYFLGAIISTMAVYMPKIGRTVKAAIVFSLFVLNFTILGPLKELSKGGGGADGELLKNVFESIRINSYRADFDSYQVSANAAEYFSSHSYYYFQNIISALLFFIPRSLWPNKSIGTSLVVHEAFGYDYTNISFPLPVEFFAAGGYFGVALLSIVFGLYFGGLELKSGRNASVKVIGWENVVFAVLAGYMPIVLRGALNSITPQFGFGLIFIFVTIVVERIRNRRSTSNFSRVER